MCGRSFWAAGVVSLGRIRLTVQRIAAGALCGVALAGTAAGQTRAYVANGGDLSVSAIDVETGTLAGTVLIGTQTSHIAALPNGSRVYVSKPWTNQIAVIDSATLTVIGQISPGNFPLAVAVSPDGSRLYTETGGGIQIIDTTSHANVGTIAVGGQQRAIRLSADGTRLYVTGCNGDNMLRVVDTTTRAVINTAPVGLRPCGVTLNPSGTTIYVSNSYANTVTVLDAATLAVVTTIAVGREPYGMAVTADGATLYVANFGDAMSVVSTATNTVVTTLPRKGNPINVVVAPAAGRALVAANYGWRVDLLDTSSHTIVGSVAVGNFPDQMAIAPGPAAAPLPPPPPPPDSTPGGSGVLPGFDANTVPPNDDGSTAEIDLGFAINFFGLAADGVFVNNNGKVTIGAPLPHYTPFSLNQFSVRILAPFFADVDTRTNGGSVTYGPGTVNGRPAFGVTWRDVDFYDSATVDHPARNRFQLVIIERSDTGAGNFDFWFNYDRIVWETGQASGGNAYGLGGFSARVGYASGSGIFYEQAGSAVNGALLDSNLATGLTHNRLNSDRDGRYVFEVRNGAVLPPTAAFRRYLAEAATGTFFDTRIALFNANDQSVTATLRFLRSDGQVFPVQVAMPARSRRTVDPETVAGLEARDFSIVVESNSPLIVDRTMTWGAGGYGSHAETSVDAPERVWYLAEGSTSGDFSLFYLLQNPNPTAVTATIDFLLPPGQAPLQRRYTLRPNSRLTIAVDAIPELASTDLSGVITASAPIIVERAMYMSHPGQPFSAGHESAGVVAPARAWFLAEGATGPFFDMFILMANPGTSAAEVEARYLTSTGTVLQKRYTLAPQSRTTIWVDAEQFGSQGLALANAAVSTTLTVLQGPPIIVERTMWWPSPETSTSFWTEAHNSPGAIATGTSWGLAEGETGGASGLATFILVANTSATPASIRATLYFEDGTTSAVDFNVAGNTRLTIDVDRYFPTAAGRRFGAIVNSLNGAQIVVERAMYSNAAGVVWAAGTNALGTRLRQ